jgi:YVTN family beta-propeller protein
LDLDPATGQVFVTTENPNRLLVIDPKSHEILKDYDTKGESSHMVTRSPDGKTAFVSNISTQNISVIDLETSEVELIPVGERPEGSDITADGKTLYVACRESHVISVIDTESNVVVSEVRTGKGPNRVQLTPDEKLLVYSLVHDKQIGIADAERGEEIATIDLGGSPVSLQLSRDGERALTAAQSDDVVYVVSLAERRVIKQFATAEGAGPDPVLEIYP